MGIKEDYKKSPNELREQPFRPRIWHNQGKPISAEGLRTAIKEANEELVNPEVRTARQKAKIDDLLGEVEVK